ncbi:hypothetical protein [uncultured Dubosiella sp.]|uniref:hypothetical protein n=1 Tax=uncultured Dubosiella sp. TaxID=1937011 RepID=UPI0027308188|nr:hypothetical protein [uncultured Dubosiella sp.]
MKNTIVIVLEVLIVVCVAAIGFVFWKKHQKNSRQQQKEKMFKEKFGVEPPRSGQLTLEDQKVFPSYYQLSLKYKKENDQYVWEPSRIRMGRFLLLLPDPYQAIEYIQYLYNEGVPLVQKGEKEPSLPTLEDLKAALPAKAFLALRHS